MTHSYIIEGMTCNNCALTVQKLLQQVKGIKNVSIDVNKNLAEITMEVHIALKDLQQALSGTKYTIKEYKNLATVVFDSAELDSKPTFKTYLPILLIFSYITTVTLTIQLVSNNFNWMEWMRHFMAGFFLVFSFFKLLDVRGFATSYSSYDIIAKRFIAWGFIYPFIELGLGISFLFPLLHTWSNILTLLIMGISIIGVIQSILRKNNFQCACLGAIFKLPLSKITLFEDSLMIVMSATGILMYV